MGMVLYRLLIATFLYQMAIQFQYCFEVDNLGNTVNYFELNLNAFVHN